MGWGGVYLSYLLSQQMPVATRPGGCCATFSAGRFKFALSLRSLSLGFFLFRKRFSPFLPRDRTLTLRRRSRGVENTGVYNEKGRDGCFAFLFIDCAYRYFQIAGHSSSLRPLPRNTLDRTIYICTFEPRALSRFSSPADISRLRLCRDISL